MMKLRSKKYFSRSISKLSRSDSNVKVNNKGGDQKEQSCVNGEIKWEMRPGGMLVQRRESNGQTLGEGFITIRVSNVSNFHDISIDPTSTFGQLKMILSLMTGLEAKEQRLLFKGKERDDCEYLHMVGVRDKDKVLLLQDPAIKEMKLLSNIRNPCPTIIV